MTVFARKKPVVIECMKWTGENSVAVKDFCGDKVSFDPDVVRGCSVAAIKTLEGTMTATPGDIIIKGVNGEFYPCKPDIFEKTYEIVNGKPTSVELVETKHDLLTNKYTKVLEEKDFQYNAPHTFKVVRKDDTESLVDIHFQEGPIKECGVNGCANEDLLIMVARRLEGFQNSEFRCRENELALTHIEEALLWLRKRTMGREARGVEGTHTV